MKHYTSNDGKRTSRNIWYGDADISVDGEYGKNINLNEDFMDNLCEIIKNDLSKNAANEPTETNWYILWKWCNSGRYWRQYPSDNYGS